MEGDLARVEGQETLQVGRPQASRPSEVMGFVLRKLGDTMSRVLILTK